MRRLVRGAIRKGPFTKGQRDVTLAVVNHWFHHKGKNQPIHPGREKLAAKAKVSVRTVATTLAILRASGVLHAVSHLRGGHDTATKYKVNIPALLTLCGCDWLDDFIAGYTRNCTVEIAGIARLGRAKIAHGIRDVETSLCQGDYLPIEESLIDYSDDFGSDPDE